MNLILSPIATFFCGKENPYEASRQGASTANENEIGEIRFEKGHQFEQALEGIEHCSHLWLIYQFHRNTQWKPKVLPPRGQQKIGVFATRSPYRPNSLGLSCVELIGRERLSLFVRKFDLLNETPIFDVKPYLPYADSFPTAQVQWLKQAEQDRWQVLFSNRAQEQLLWLEKQGLDQIRSFILQQLEFYPLNTKKKRLREVTAKSATLCYRTWRIQFAVESALETVTVEGIFSGYTDEDLISLENPYQDKDLHRLYLESRLS
jgi:tRNA-Thr(GGU) m(6)t(6)A37 methyltransferase TsaA